jgi:acetyl esterase
MGEVFDGAYAPDPADRADPLVSPAHPSDTADLTGIAPALVITAALDRLRAEGERYARRLERAGALAEYHDVPGVDHGYDMRDTENARGVYDLIVRYVRRATEPSASPAQEDEA